MVRIKTIDGEVHEFSDEQRAGLSVGAASGLAYSVQGGQRFFPFTSIVWIEDIAPE